MLGILLNSLNKAEKSANILAGTVNFKDQIFGNGTSIKNIEDGRSIDGETLAAENGYSLEFKDLTIPANARVFTNTYRNGWQSVMGRYAPLYIKCSGTLSVEGSLDADNCGGIAYPADDVWFNVTTQSPIPVQIDPMGYGYSAHYTTFSRLQNYGANAGFFNFGLFLAGGGGGGLRSGKHNHHSLTWGISAGGGTGGNGGLAIGGGGGGFVAIYFKELWINNKLYGRDSGCEVWRVSANGRGGYSDTYSGFGTGSNNGGGSIIIAANVINISGTGKISADGGVPSWRTELGIRCSFLNNIPQLGGLVFLEHQGTAYRQYGIRWDNDAKQFLPGVAIGDTYYYDDGTGNGIPNSFYEAGSSFYTGGAGVALGFKVG